MIRKPTLSIPYSASLILRTGLVVLLLMGIALANISPAFSKQAEANDTCYLSIGSDIYYAGFFTTWMWADERVAYCANPEIPTPAPGTYTKENINAPSGRNQDCAAVLWFGYGGPGFSTSMWPSSWYDGSPMTDARYAVLTHILLAHTYTSSSDSALYGCALAFREWCQQYVIGYNNTGSLLSSNATGIQISNRSQEVPNNFSAFQLNAGPTTQTVLSSAYVPHGSLELTKVSGIPEITDNNPCYSLAQAEYTVYHDEACTETAGTITTNDQGYGKLEELNPGTYYIKETKAATGYALDQTLYTASVSPNETSAINGSIVSDTPQSNPIDIAVKKADASLSDSEHSQGNATLAGAEFTLEYYKDYFSSVDEARNKGEVNRTWVIKTDENGTAYLDDTHKVSGDNFFLTLEGKPTIPLGTILVTETKAPLGYNLDDGFGSTPTTFLVTISPDGSGNESISTYHYPTSENSVIRGDYRLVKETATEVYGGANGSQPQDQNRILVPGIQFQIINDSTLPVVSPENGQLIQPGEVVCTITTDDNGVASTSNDNANVNGWSTPESWTGALAYGTYRIHEVIPNEIAKAFKESYGKDLLTVDDWKINITEEGQYDAPILVTNKIPQTPLKIIKTDIETGQRISLPCSFQLLDSNGNLITHATQGSDATIQDTWTTNSAGEITLPFLLEQGEYTLIETNAPEGYTLAKDSISFEVGAIYNSWDNPLEIQFPNAPQKGTISIYKTDTLNSNPVDSSTFIVEASTDIVTSDGTVHAHAGETVATLQTNSEGQAVSPPLHLGTYLVYETQAKNGYALNSYKHTIALTYQGQNTTVFDTALLVENEPTRLTLQKISSAENHEPLPNAVFHIWNDEETCNETLTTNEEGVIDITYLPQGNYHLQELTPPEGFVISNRDKQGNAHTYSFTVNSQGSIEADDLDKPTSHYTITCYNTPKSMKTTALDSISNTHEGQAREQMSIVDIVEYSGLIPETEYKLSGVLMDKETGLPALDADGNEITAERIFTPKDYTGSLKLEFSFNGINLTNCKLVAFETITHNGEEYLNHADLEDENQTVSVVSIHTSAHLPNNNSKEAAASQKLVLTDTVSYENLTPGKTYKLFSSIYYAKSDTPLTTSNNTPYIDEITFTPDNSHGYIDINITIDASELAGKDIVFYELLTDEYDRPIAIHADPNDKNQTIHIRETPRRLPSSGDSLQHIVAAALIAICASTILSIFIWLKNKRQP